MPSQEGLLEHLTTNVTHIEELAAAMQHGPMNGAEIRQYLSRERVEHLAQLHGLLHQVEKSLLEEYGN